jgi:hypothetical protein
MMLSVAPMTYVFVYPLKSCGIILEKKSRNLGQPERHNIPNKSMRRLEIIEELRN